MFHPAPVANFQYTKSESGSSSDPEDNSYSANDECFINEDDEDINLHAQHQSQESNSSGNTSTQTSTHGSDDDNSDGQSDGGDGVVFEEFQNAEAPPPNLKMLTDLLTERFIGECWTNICSCTT
jgi:FlaG/FlaF family flagellin (archaellin)